MVEFAVCSEYTRRFLIGNRYKMAFSLSGARKRGLPPFAGWPG